MMMDYPPNFRTDAMCSLLSAVVPMAFLFFSKTFSSYIVVLDAGVGVGVIERT